MRYKAINPNVEVNGQTVLSFVNALGYMKHIGLSILAEKGIANPDPEGWYSQQKWLDAITYIAEEAGIETLYEIGSAIPENAKFPTEINDIHKALSLIDIAYHMNHRLNKKVLFNDETKKTEEGIGNYHYNFINNKKAEIICDNPYPCDFDRGIIHSMAKKFKPSESVFVKIEHDKTKSCRENGDKTCSYIVSW